MNDRKLSRVRIITLCLCFLVVAADGFDLASVGYVAPLLKQQWSLVPAQLGSIFGAGLFGLAIGGFLLGPLADRIGRRRVILLSMLVFGIASLACGLVTSATSLVALRFVTGVGLGGAMPTAITLASEFSPRHNHAWLVTLMFCGFTIGLAFGGAVAALLIPSFGWRGVFVFGGIAPLCLSPAIWSWLPESVRFMAGKPRYATELREVLYRLTGTQGATPDSVMPDDRSALAANDGIVRTLFSTYYRRGTLLLWLTFFCTLWVYYQVSSWLPTVITETGITAARAATIGAMMPLGGTLGSLINARFMDRHNPFIVLAGSYLVATVSLVLVGAAIGSPTWLYIAVFCTGLGLSGAQTAANVLVSRFYSTGARATGVSWALAVGRIGSIVGAVYGGFLLAALPSTQVAFMVFAMPLVVAGLAMLAAGRIYRDHP